MIEIKQLSAGYGRHIVLHDIELRLAKGEIVALVGPNGAGKSTLAKAVTGLLACHRGEIRLDGQRIDHTSARERVARGITLVPEGRQVFATLSVSENLMLGSYAVSKAATDSTMRTVLALFPALESRMAEPSGNLSGGQQQMLAIGRGLMANPDFLVLDEPSLGLSPLLVRDTFRIIQRLRDQGRGVLLSEQNACMSLAIADRGYVLENGKITMSGAGSLLLRDSDIAKRYLGGGASSARSQSQSPARRTRVALLRKLFQNAV